MEPQKYLSRQEAAAHLRVSVRTLDALTAERKIVGARIGGSVRGRLIFRTEDLDAYVEKQLREAVR